MDAILKIAPPNNKKEPSYFLGMINSYQDIWKQQSDTLAPLNELTSSTTKWEWTENHQKAFDKTKEILSKKALLTYLDFNKPFNVHTNAFDSQLGDVII